ncbi:hypothetical protein A3K80_03145 [Candidatus Bathyarchaeota archaeon RBG_13_38_9]|nr:MAG: hypothetical protein A3K80_03145 [Candidatus Bathyarchaeota archaeon RBG_13_38_9]
MNQTYRLLIPVLLLIAMLIGSVSAPCPDIPPSPYNPESPEEDIIMVEAYIDPITTTTTTTTTTVAHSLRPIVVGPTLHVKVTFAAPTPPPGKALTILITQLKGVPPSEIVINCGGGGGPAKTAYEFVMTVDDGSTNIAVYAWLDATGTDRAPNTDFYQITSITASDPNVFQDYEPAPVGGVVVPKNSLEILMPYIALAGLVAAISTVYVIKKRK